MVGVEEVFTIPTYFSNMGLYLADGIYTRLTNLILPSGG